jgi:hypothetical protein
MRIGINRSASAIWFGGIFHYEPLFMEALSQIAKRFRTNLFFSPIDQTTSPNWHFPAN